MGLPSFIKAKPAESLTDDTVKTAVREAIAESDMVDQFLDTRHVTATSDSMEGLREQLKLDKLVADDFPFDESQVEMIEGVVNHLVHNGGQGACATGAAGTGKTTCTKKIADRLLESASFLRAVDMETYFKRGEPAPDADDTDDSPKTRWVPSMCFVGFTGRSTQMIKKNFPRSWHTNIMTIHRMLAYMPVWDENFDPETGSMKKTMRFEPTYGPDNLLPWDIIVIDEAGMVSIDLWENIRLAMKPTCKVVMIGDINQLPPVHGRSVFGFAMGTWPAWELTHVHRQQDSKDRIVDNAWRILKGQKPVSEGNFQMVKFDELAPKASQQVRKFIPSITDKGIYDPIRDTTITATNGEDGQRGFVLGQLPLNREFAIIFNKDNPRYIIDAGRERQKFAVGDKVMATRNDYESGITNGMTGIITDISENGAWIGERRRFGTVESVNAYMAEMDDETPDADFTLDEMMESYEAQEEGKQAAKEAKDRGPASHHVTVRFGSDEHGFDIVFSTLAEVASLMTAYVVTCHKMQGGECPVVVIILHTAHKAMHFREWLYTAVTRGSERVILLYTDQALRNVLTKQKIKGATLAAKVQSFLALSKEGILGASVKVNLAWGGQSQLPVPAEARELSNQEPAKVTDIAKPEPKLEPAVDRVKEMLRRKADERALAHAEALMGKPRVEKIIIERTRYVYVEAPAASAKGETVIDRGELVRAARFVHRLAPPKRPMLTYVAPKLLTYQPDVHTLNAKAFGIEVPVEKPTPKPGSLAFLMAKKKG